MSEPANHPPQSELLEFGLGKLPPDDSQRIEQHLDACPDCSQTVLVLQDDTFVGLVRTSKGKAPATVNADATVDIGVGTVTRFNTAAELPTELRNHSRYEILGLIGRGGMGDVYQAQHRVMNRLVALKVIKPELVQNEAAVQRFRREVQAAARLHDRNIVTAYDAEQAGSLHFLVMEYVEGVNLDEVVRRRGALPVAEACDAIRQAAKGLQHAHELGMVHRDIKPHNLMLTPAGDVKILDFGLAGIASELSAEEVASETESRPPRIANSQLTQAGSMMGTPDYIAPEQATDAHAADIRADIYSLGCTFYTLLTGRPPFDPSSVFDKIKAHAEQKPRALAEYRTDVPAEIEAILLKMLAKNPAERYQTPSEVVAALEQAASAFQPKPLPAAVRQEPSRARLVASAMIASFLAILAAVVFYIQTDKGVVRVEVADESLQVKLNGQTIEMKDGTVPFTIRAGEQRLIVRRGDFEFRTDNFELRRGEAIALKVELLAGEVVVQKDGQRFGAKPLPAEQRLIPSIADGKPSALGLLLRDKSRNLRQIGGALLEYQKKHGSFPPSAAQPTSFDANGRPYLSWRVHLLPFLGQQKLFEKFRLNEPWDSAHNKPLLAEMPAVYKPSADPTRTQLLAVVGKGTAYEGQAGLKLSDFHDGTSFTAYVVDAGPAKAMPWTKPEDLPFDAEDPIRAFGRSDWGDEFLYLMTDCTVRAIHYDTAPDSLRALFTRAAGDKFAHWAKRTTPLPTPEITASKVEDLLADAVLALDFAQEDFYEKDGKSWVRDLSGNGHDLLCEDARFSAEGPNRSSVSVGPKGSLSLPRRLIASGQPFTLAAWVHRKLSWDQGDPLVFAQRNKDGRHELSCGLGIVDAVWNLNFVSEDAYIHHPFDEDVEKSRRFARLGNWGFVAWTRDATGKLSFTTESLTQRTEHMDTGAGEEDDHEQVEIGRGLDGSLDGLVVFNRALSSLELAALCDHVDAGRKLVPPDIGVEPQVGWTPLFNGRDLTGWKTHPTQPDGWKVSDGVLIGSGDGASHMFTERGDFEDFHLRTEVKINETGNSGINFRCSDGLPRGEFPAGYEAQILNGVQFFDNGKPELQKTGSLYSLQRVEKRLVEPNEWFTLEIIAQGNHIIIKVNGAVTADYTDAKRTYTKGHLALQQMSRSKPGPQPTIVQFKSIEVKSLSAEAAITIGMNDEFGMLFEGRLVAPAELSRLLREALKENADRAVAIDLPKRPWSVSGHVDQLELIARIAGAKRIIRPAWAENEKEILGEWTETNDPQRGPVHTFKFLQNGEFHEAGPMAISLAGGAKQWVTKDLDGDGKPDIVPFQMSGTWELKNGELHTETTSSNVLDFKNDRPGNQRRFKIETLTKDKLVLVLIENDKETERYTAFRPSIEPPRPQSQKINLLRELPSSKEWITDVAYPENDRAITVAVDGVVRVWKNGGKELDQHQLPFGGQAAISPDGRLVVVASAANDKDMATVALWELDGWKERWKIEVPTTTTTFTPKFLVDVRFAPNDRVLVRSNVDSGVAIVDAADGKVLSRYPAKGPATGAASLSPDGKRLFVRQMAPAPFGRIYQIADGAELAQIDTRDVVLDAVWSRDGAQLILAESTLSEGRIAVFNGSTGELVRRWVAEPKGIESLALGQGNLLATGGLTRIAVWDWSTGKLLAAVDSPKQDGDARLAIALSPDGKQLISGGARWLDGEDRLPRIWQLPESVWRK